MEVVANPLLVSRGTRQKLKIDFIPECFSLDTQVLNIAAQSMELKSIFLIIKYYFYLILHIITVF